MSQPITHTISISVSQEDCSKLIHIVDIYAQGRNQEWKQWAKQISEIIQSAVNTSSSVKIPSINLSQSNWNALGKIIQETCQALDNDWIQWASKISDEIQRAAETVMSSNLSWPDLPTTLAGELLFWSGVIFTVIGFLLSPFGGWCLFAFSLPLLGAGWYLKDNNQKKVTVALAIRNATQKATSSLMMGRAKYVGGHPMISESQTVVIGLSEKAFTIYEILQQSDAIQPKVSIPLSSVEKTSTGRPRTAHEIFDEDDRSVIDVVEGSPFLQLGFQLDGQKYAVSLSAFENGSPTDWGNRIISLRHALLTSKSGEVHQP